MSVLAHQRTIDELGTPLIDTEFCVIDLETTGTDRQRDMITEIGAVRYRGGECLGTFQTLVNPGCAIPPHITVLTGLTDALVAPAPRVEAVLGSLLEFIGTAVVVGHNVSFDLGFINAALERTGRPTLAGPAIDTVALARRLVRSEVPNCRLGTLAQQFGLPHQPAHRALDDALATGDLLHLLIERAAGHGVMGCDDLMELARIGRHPQAAKLRLTADLPRGPGVYLFHDSAGDVLYVGKATNLRQRVRSYFGSDDRRKVGPLLRELATLSHIPTPDPLTAEVLETRLITRHLPRYNRTGTSTHRYCYIRLDHRSPWPRLSICREATADAVHLGPLRSRRQATLVIEALQSVVGLRRCSTRLGAAHVPDPQATPCSAAQLGVAACPCAGVVDRERYRAEVHLAIDVMTGRSDLAAERLTAKMAALAAEHRYEEAASVRDRLDALLAVVARQRLIDTLRRAGSVEVTDGSVTWHIDDGRLVDAHGDGCLTGAIPVAPDSPGPTHLPVQRHLLDEAWALARQIQARCADLRVTRCSGEWGFPVPVPERVTRLDTAGTPSLAPTGVGPGGTDARPAESTGRVG